MLSNLMNNRKEWKAFFCVANQKQPNENMCLVSLSSLCCVICPRLRTLLLS